MIHQPLYIGRFAPSPTGPLHFGSMVAAVGSYLQARSQNGEWLVRIEDIDPPREVPGAADQILRTLEAFGLYWDGPVVYQSQRLSAYEELLQNLLKTQQAYPCACSRKIIEQRMQGSSRYDGYCRNNPPRHTTQQIAYRITTNSEPIKFNDPIQGNFEHNLLSESGDFVIKRADGFFAYQLAVVADDADQRITEVVRGSDLLSSTPRQIHLFNLLKQTVPNYCHLPIAIDKNGDKLSKQTFAKPVEPEYASQLLFQVFQFLGQQPPMLLAQESVENQLQWALKNWSVEHIPKSVSGENQ